MQVIEFKGNTISIDIEQFKEIINQMEDSNSGKIFQFQIQTDNVSDGYHTFGELYEHRITLFIALCKLVHEKHENSLDVWVKPSPVWRTRVHSDGSVIDGWFLLGINTEPGKQITYHLPNSKWMDCEFVDIIEDAPEWDGHTSEDVLERLRNL